MDVDQLCTDYCFFLEDVLNEYLSHSEKQKIIKYRDTVLKTLITQDLYELCIVVLITNTTIDIKNVRKVVFKNPIKKIIDFMKQMKNTMYLVNIEGLCILKVGFILLNKETTLTEDVLKNMDKKPLLISATCQEKSLVKIMYLK